MPKKRTEKVEKAFKLGIAAFDKGAKCVHAHDKDLLDLLNGRGIPFAEFVESDKAGHEENLAMYKAWSQGWTMANLGQGEENL